MIPRSTLTHTNDAPLIQYASGHTKCRMRTGTQTWLPLVGFHSECGKDDDFDRAMHTAGLTAIEIRHGSGDIVQHWSFGEKLDLYVVSGGPIANTVAASLRNGNRARTAQAGIGLRWLEGGKSKLAIRGFLLWDYDGLVQLTVSSRMTDYLLTALVRHLVVAEIADSLVDRARHPSVVGFHELHLPLGAAADEVAFGKADTAMVTPLECQHPAEITRDYIKTLWRPTTIHAASIECWESVQAWAAEYGHGTEESE